MSIEKPSLSALDSKRVERIARTLARLTDLPTGIAEDLSVTVGNVTFDRNHALAATAEDLALITAFYSDEGYIQEGLEPEHLMITASDPDYDGWTERSSEVVERPSEFDRVINPPGRLRKFARRVLIGN